MHDFAVNKCPLLQANAYRINLSIPLYLSRERPHKIFQTFLEYQNNAIMLSRKRLNKRVHVSLVCRVLTAKYMYLLITLPHQFLKTVTCVSTNVATTHPMQ